MWLFRVRSHPVGDVSQCYARRGQRDAQGILIAKRSKTCSVRGEQIGMVERVVLLRVCIYTGSNEADPEELTELGTQLREQLLELDVERVDFAVGGQTPPGTRAGEAFVAGALVVTLVQSSGLLTALIDMVQLWISRIGGRSVRLEIDGDVLEVTGIGLQDQRELIQAWIDQHTAK
jgi:hypothetical protein